jgi:hypothetical protein
MTHEYHMSVTEVKNSERNVVLCSEKVDACTLPYDWKRLQNFV